MTLEVGDNGASQSRSQSQSPEDSGDQETTDMAEQPEPNGKTDTVPQTGNGQTKSASNAKDPLRPRRKKARRACYACQRAHLTCGQYSFSTWTSIILFFFLDIRRGSFMRDHQADTLQVTSGLVRGVLNVAYKMPVTMVYERKPSTCMMPQMKL